MACFRSRGVGFVRLDTHRNAEIAIERLNGTKFHGYRERLCVKFANPNGSEMTTNSMTSDALTSNAASKGAGGGGATAAVGCELKVGNKRPFSAEDKYLQSPSNKQKYTKVS